MKEFQKRFGSDVACPTRLALWTTAGSLPPRGDWLSTPPEECRADRAAGSLRLRGDWCAVPSGRRGDGTARSPPARGDRAAGSLPLRGDWRSVPPGRRAGRAVRSGRRSVRRTRESPQANHARATLRSGRRRPSSAKLEPACPEAGASRWPAWALRRWQSERPTAPSALPGPQTRGALSATGAASTAHDPDCEQDLRTCDLLSRGWLPLNVLSEGPRRRRLVACRARRHLQIAGLDCGGQEKRETRFLGETGSLAAGKPANANQRTRSSKSPVAPGAKEVTTMTNSSGRAIWKVTRELYVPPWSSFSATRLP